MKHTASKTTAMPINAAQNAQGEIMAVQLGLKPAVGFDPPRWHVGVFGTKTGYGVYLTVLRVADDARKLAGEPT